MKHKTLPFIFCCLCLLIASAPSIWSTRSAPAIGEFAEIDNYISSSMQQFNIPGVALAITQGDEITHSKGFGTAGKGQSVTADTPFYIGSQSKSFTALAIMQLVEQNKLALDAPVQTYIPWFKVADEQASKEITVRNLLQHTSGLSESGYMPKLPADATLEMLVRDIAHARLAAPVGTKMQYFNPGYSILGYLIETVSGQSYSDYLQSHIFEPLKMTNSFADPAAAKEAGLAQGYSQMFMLAIPIEQPVSKYDVPAGFIMASANDMARFMMAMVNGGELDGVRVLSSENIQLMFTPNIAIHSSYGFGWYIGTYHGVKSFTHGGATERFQTSVLILPEKKLTLVMLVNENHLIKGMTDLNTMFWNVADLLTGDPITTKEIPSLVYGWGFLLLLVFIIVSTVRKIIKMPQWRSKMLTWDSRRRWRDILQHLFMIAITVVIIAVIAPAFLQRGFSMKWFVGFLPDVAIVIGALILEDMIQVIMKIWMIARCKTT